MAKLISLLVAVLFSMAVSCGATMAEGENNMKNALTLTLKATYKGFQAPTGLAVDEGGNLYVSNWSGGTVTKVDTKGKRSVFADGMGSPAGLAFDKSGNLYVSDYSQDLIYKLGPDGKKAPSHGGCTPPPA